MISEIAQLARLPHLNTIGMLLNCRNDWYRGPNRWGNYVADVAFVCDIREQLRGLVQIWIWICTESPSLHNYQYNHQYQAWQFEGQWRKRDLDRDTYLKLVQGKGTI